MFVGDRVAAVIAKVVKRPREGRSGKSYGSDVSGLLRYLFGPGDREEHTNPRLVAAWSGDVSALQPGVFTKPSGERYLSTGNLAGLLTEFVRRSGSVNLSDPHVYHVAVSIPAVDGALADDAWERIARDVVERVGLESGDGGGSRWVAVHHGRSAEGNDHVHVVATLVDGKGHRVWPRNDFRALREVCREWEQQLGLTVTARAGEGSDLRATGGARFKDERLGRQVGVRERLTGLVRQVKPLVASPEEFRVGMQQRGARVEWRYSTVNPGERTGMRIGLVGDVDAAGEQIWWSGSRLGGHSLPALEHYWQARADVMGWDVKQAVGVLSAAREQLGAGGDTREARALVRACADVFDDIARVVDPQRAGRVFEDGWQAAGGHGDRGDQRAADVTGAGMVLLAASRNSRHRGDRMVYELMAQVLLLSGQLAAWSGRAGRPEYQTRAARRVFEMLEQETRERKTAALADMREQLASQTHTFPASARPTGPTQTRRPPGPSM